jgi:hypothetical protein
VRGFFIFHAIALCLSEKSFFAGWVKPLRSHWVSYFNPTYAKKMIAKKYVHKGEPNKSMGQNFRSTAYLLIHPLA